MRDLKPEVQAFLDRVSNFIDTEIRPNESKYQQEMEDGGRWCVPPIMEEIKTKAKAEGLWNFFLPGYEGEFGTGKRGGGQGSKEKVLSTRTPVPQLHTKEDKRLDFRAELALAF